MRFSLTILLLVIVVHISNAQRIDEVRNEYHAQLFASKDMSALIKKLENRERSCKLNAYYACARMVGAERVLSPIQKLKTFNEGKGILEKEISKKPNDIELRYLRLSIQLNAPDILGYNKAIEKDKLFIIRNFDTLSSSKVKSYIRKLFKNSEQITEDELNKLM